MRKQTKTDSQRIVETLQDILITELGMLGVPQLDIRKILGVDIRRVNRIVKHIKKKGG